MSNGQNDNGAGNNNGNEDGAGGVDPNALDGGLNQGVDAAGVPLNPADA